jgi:hypothetical protein
LKFGEPAGKPIAELTPSPKLAALVKKSRELLASTGAEAEGGGN